MTKEIRCPKCKKLLCTAAPGSHVKVWCRKCKHDVEEIVPNESYQDRLTKKIEKKHGVN